MNTEKESLWHRMNKRLEGHMMNKRLEDFMLTFIEDYVFAPVTFLLVSIFGLIIIALAIAFMIAVMFALSPGHGADMGG